MVRAKNCETTSTFVKVMQKKTLSSFFRTLVQLPSGFITTGNEKLAHITKVWRCHLQART